ncbi:hypothetical protein CSUI_001084 [Cystoisospora suis]|uniref:Uncharacterized protein n=1 Tax=Cystoisospora suis TaxID=483139 RepID=A0A2C6LDN3_9APIC|nr:hypothetical protein CSUI_001084 [Cystoisospora suis]
MESLLAPLGCTGMSTLPMQKQALTLMDSLLQDKAEEAGGDSCKAINAGVDPLMSRLSTSTWCSEIDYLSDPSVGTFSAPAFALSAAGVTETGNQLSLMDLALAANPLPGATPWDREAPPTTGLAAADLQGLFQPNVSSHIECGPAELAPSLVLPGLPETEADLHVPAALSSPMPAPSARQPAELQSPPCNPTAAKRRRRATDAAESSMHKPAPPRQSRKRYRQTQAGDDRPQSDRPLVALGSAGPGCFSAQPENYETQHSYALLPFDQSKTLDTSLHQGELQQPFLYEQLVPRPVEEHRAPTPDSGQLNDAQYETVNLGEYDMCEISVSWHLPRLPPSPDRPIDAVPIRRMFGVNAGMTLFNLHRIICISMGLTDDSQASAFNHVWVLPSNNTYGGGPLTKSRACGASRIKVTTDRAVEYRHSITVSLDQHSRVVPTPDSVLLYVLGCVQLHVQLVGVMRNRTKQNSLIWVPRCIANGTYGTGPATGTDWNSSAEICRHMPSFLVDVNAINTQFIDTRFSKNTSFSRRTKMVRAEGIDEEILQCYGESIHDFWQNPDRVRDLSIRVTRQSMGGNKRRYLENRKEQRAIEQEDYTEESPQEVDRSRSGEELLSLVPLQESAAGEHPQQELRTLAWHDPPLLQGFISVPGIEMAAYDPHGDPSSLFAACPNSLGTLPLPIPFATDVPCSTSAGALGLISPELPGGNRDCGASFGVRSGSSNSHTAAEPTFPNPSIPAASDSGASHGVRRSQRLLQKHQCQGDDGSLHTPATTGLSAGNGPELLLPHAIKDIEAVADMGSRNEGSCRSTDTGEVPDCLSVNGSSLTGSSVCEQALVPGCDVVDCSTLGNNSAHGTPWSAPQLWSSVQFVLREDSGIPNGGPPGSLNP